MRMPVFAKPYLDLGGLLQLFPISLPNCLTYHGRAEWYELNRRSQGTTRTTEVCDYSPRTSSTIVYLIAYSSGVGEVHGPKDQYYSQLPFDTRSSLTISTCVVDTLRIVGTSDLLYITIHLFRSPSSYKTTKSLIFYELTYSQGLLEVGRTQKVI